MWEEFSNIWAFIVNRSAPLPRNIDELISFMAFCPTREGGRQENRRWQVLFQTAAWCLWKAYLSVSFASPHCYWHPESALAYYRDIVRTRILSDRVLCIGEKYQDQKYNPMVFKNLWGEYPRDIRIRRGPACINRSIPFAHRVEATLLRSPSPDSEIIDNLDLGGLSLQGVESSP